MHIWYSCCLELRRTDCSLCSVAAPAEEVKEADKASVPAAVKEPLDLTAAISSINSAKKVFSESKLPPSLPTSHKRWVPEQAPDAPHDPNAYFPMLLYK